MLADVYRTRFYDLYPDFGALSVANRTGSSLGIPAYRAEASMRATVARLFEAVLKRRKESPPGSRSIDTYVYTSRAALAWLHKTLVSDALRVLVDLSLLSRRAFLYDGRAP